MSSISLEEIGKLKPGRYMVIDGEAYTISSMQKSAPGKHGHAKYRVEAAHIITGSKKVVIYSGHEKVQVPVIEKKTAQILSVSGNTAQVMDMETYETFDLPIPEEFKDKIQANAQILFWNILGQKIIKQIK